VVDLLAAYSKRADLRQDLAVAVRQLKNAEADQDPHGRSVRGARKRSAIWRIQDRLTEDDVRLLVQRRREGATIHQLAAGFAIGLTSVKRLLREAREQ